MFIASITPDLLILKDLMILSRYMNSKEVQTKWKQCRQICGTLGYSVRSIKQPGRKHCVIKKQGNNLSGGEFVAPKGHSWLPQADYYTARKEAWYNWEPGKLPQTCRLSQFHFVSFQFWALSHSENVRGHCENYFDTTCHVFFFFFHLDHV